ncbi:unnamed protein product [Mytilus edulis]|uniref:Uncharacterized protein n=1 Tax=Mytilus edulis TaxID=6550 RepID=A0A8S3PQ90_MYTED|nr:unnamed protein product [Mytilus edulis]
MVHRQNITQGRLERTHWYGSQTKYNKDDSKRTHWYGSDKISQGTTRGVHIGMGHRQNITGTTQAYEHIGMGHRQNITRDDSSVHIGMVHRQNITKGRLERTHWYSSQTKYHKGRLERTHWYGSQTKITRDDSSVIGIVHDSSVHIGMGHRKNTRTTRAYILVWVTDKISQGRLERTHWYGVTDKISQGTTQAYTLV